MQALKSAWGSGWFTDHLFRTGPNVVRTAKARPPGGWGRFGDYPVGRWCRGQAERGGKESDSFHQVFMDSLRAQT